MQLPFTREQFFDVFAAYNADLWPGVVGLWIASVLGVVLLLLPRRRPVRWVCVLLTAHWLWSAAYHAAFFTSINPAAWIFAVLFFVEATVFFWVGVVQGRLSFAPWRTAWAPVGWALIAYSLLYPALNAVDHHSLWRSPTFGVPCPTTIFTTGLLMLAAPRSWGLSTIPVIWSVIGASAAPVLGVRADYALPIAGIALGVFTQRGSTTAACDQTNGKRQLRVRPRRAGSR